MSCICEEGGSLGSGGGGGGENNAEIEDPFCQANNPRIITYEQVRNARKALEGGVEKTNLIRSKLSDLAGMNIYLKCDFLQASGSFKERGARYAIMNLADDKKSSGVYAASSGNHALAMAYHGRQLGVAVTVVMPSTAPIMKSERCRGYGAEVILFGANLAEAKNHAMKLAKEKGATYINGYDHPDVLAGAGSLGIEILEQLPTANAIVIPVGGGGLLAGMSVAIKTLKPCTKVIGVESEKCQAFTNSLKVGKAVVGEVLPSLADGLAVSLPGYNSLATAKNLVDRMVIVKEEDIAVSILRLVELEKFVIEGAGATALAAVLSGQMSDFKNKNVVVVLSGANIDTTILGRTLERGLAADGRYLKLYVTVTDRPGSIAELTKLIASVGVCIKSATLERTWVMTDVYSMVIKVVCETRDYDHALELEKILKDHYKEVNLVHAEFPASTIVHGYERS